MQITAWGDDATAAVSEVLMDTFVTTIIVIVLVTMILTIKMIAMMPINHKTRFVIKDCFLLQHDNAS